MLRLYDLATRPMIVRIVVPKGMPRSENAVIVQGSTGRRFVIEEDNGTQK